MNLTNLSDGLNVPLLVSLFLNLVFVLGIVVYLLKSKAFEKNQKDYRDFFTHSNDAMLILDADHRFIEVNDKAVELCGYSRDELLKLSVMDIIPVEQKERSEEEFDRLSREGHYEKFTGRIYARDGGIRHVEVNSSAIYKDGKMVGSRDIVRDITTRVEAEEKQKELIEKLQNARDEVKTLKGILRLCLFCKKVHDEEGTWEPIDLYIRDHSCADISHSICPDCMKTQYPEHTKPDEEKN